MLTNRYETAMKFVATVHDGHQRKGTQVACLSHLLSVSALVMECGGREALKRDIELRFGAEVLAIVRQCTDDEYLPADRPSEKSTPEDCSATRGCSGSPGSWQRRSRQSGGGALL